MTTGDFAVLFDMDGVLLDTERLKARAHTEALRSFGGDLPPQAYAEFMGRSQREAQEGFAAAAGVLVDHDAYHAEFSRLYADMLSRGVPTMPGALDLLATLRSAGVRLALVTSSLRWMLDRVLSGVAMAPLFEAVVCADDVAHEKPAPDAYLAALRQLALPAGSAIVVEDTEVGVAAGNAAGCRVIAVRHEFNVRHDFSAAVRTIDGFVPVTETAAALRELLYATPRG